MPIYEYVCRKCGKKTEVIQRLKARPLAQCPSCGGKVKKAISAPAIQFKGSGWYVTDYGSGATKASRSEGSESGEGSEKSAEKSDKSDRSDKSDKSDRSDKSERAERSAKAEKAEKSAKSEKASKGEKKRASKKEG